MSTFKFRKNVKFAACAGASLFAMSMLTATPVQAEDCLLDRDNDGVVDAATDNDGAPILAV
ncbi:MAG: hypothetical protein IPH79_06035 [Sphingomonadales bacterium]|nr:hypothetical protein [Sphingomonadales bacterium]